MTENFFTERGATKLAKRFERYWQAQGFAGIETRVVDDIVDEELCERSERRTIYFVRSNIGPLGFPPHTLEEGVAS